MMVILTGVKLYLIVVLICISSIAIDVEIFFHMPMGLLYVLLGELSVQVICSFFSWTAGLHGVESCELFLNLLF